MNQSIIVLDKTTNDYNYLLTDSKYNSVLFLLLIAEDEVDLLNIYNKQTNIYYLKAPYDDLTLINKIKDILLIKEVLNDPDDLISRRKIIQAIFKSTKTGFMISEKIQKVRKLFMSIHISQTSLILNYIKKSKFI